MEKSQSQSAYLDVMSAIREVREVIEFKSILRCQKSDVMRVCWWVNWVGGALSA